MDIIELWSGSTRALVSIDGAWLTNLSDDRGDILYPKRRLKTASGESKARGGLHVCLPNFGPGGNSGLAQHGFGREQTWQVTEQAADRVVMKLQGGHPDYAGLVSTLDYQLKEASLTTTLTVENAGQSDLRLSPGFHPYFALGDNEARVMIDDEPIDIDDLAETRFVAGSDRRLQTQRRKFQLHSAQLNTWAEWTDQLASYICVEPTLAGNAFLSDEADSLQLLTPGQSRTYQLSLAWL